LESALTKAPVANSFRIRTSEKTGCLQNAAECEDRKTRSDGERQDPPSKDEGGAPCRKDAGERILCVLGPGRTTVRISCKAHETRGLACWRKACIQIIVGAHHERGTE